MILCLWGIYIVEVSHRWGVLTTYGDGWGFVVTDWRLCKKTRPFDIFDIQ